METCVRSRRIKPQSKITKDELYKMQTNSRLTEETVSKIEKCLFDYGQTCEVKIEHGEQVVVSINRKKMRDTKVPAYK